MTVGTVRMKYHSISGPDKEAEYEPYASSTDDTAV